MKTNHLQEQSNEDDDNSIEDHTTHEEPMNVGGQAQYGSQGLSNLIDTNQYNHASQFEQISGVEQHPTFSTSYSDTYRFETDEFIPTAPSPNYKRVKRDRDNNTGPRLSTTNLSPSTSPSIDNYEYFENRHQHHSTQRKQRNYFPNAIHSPETIRVSTKKEFHNALRKDNLEAMHNVEFNIVLQYNFTKYSKPVSLVLGAMISLVANFLRANGCKYFRDASHSKIIELRRQFHKLSIKYFDQSITSLKELLSQPQYDISIALITSSVLNKVSLYECNDFSIPTTFLNGMISIFHDLYKDRDIGRFSKELRWSLHFLDLSSKSAYIPSYNPKFLDEFLSKCDRLKILLQEYFKIFPDDPKKRRIIYDYSNLSIYSRFVSQVIKSNNGDASSLSSQQLYEILRRWYTIVSPSAQILQHLKHPAEKLLAYFHLGFSRCLENLFPQVMSLFLFSFNGGIPLYLEFQRHHTLEFDEAYTKDLPEELTMEFSSLFSYMLRSGTFFRKRFNIMAILFGDQRIDPEIGSEMIKKNMNEVMVTEFDSTSFLLINFPHLPGCVNLCIDGFPNERYLTRDIFYYNKEHFEWISSHPRERKSMLDRSKDSRTSLSTLFAGGTSSTSIINPSSFDPLLNFHIRNTSSLDLSYSSKARWERRIEKIRHSTDSDYSIWFEWDDCKRIMKVLESHYELFFKNYPNLPPPVSLVDINPESWLLRNDFDPYNLVNRATAPKIFNRRNVTDPDLLNVKIQNILNSAIRRKAVHHSYIDNEIIEYSDEQIFYNDLDEALYVI